MPAKPIPEGYHTATPYLVVKGADKTIEFLKQAFGATPSFEPMMSPDGKVMHADLMIGDSHVMLSEASDQHPAMQSMVHLYVPNVDAVYQRARRRRRQVVLEPTDQFYGDRGAGVKDHVRHAPGTSRPTSKMCRWRSSRSAPTRGYKQQKGKAA